MDVKLVMWGMLILSSVFLAILLVRNRRLGRWLMRAGVNAVVAAFLLYGLNLLSGYTHLEIPVNASTMATVTVLGVPGLMLLAGLKVVLL
ncbi:pro-sigmaK processing inhibitor BofA family protein [Paenibacillus athensensis]|uniref:Pro-sigmaK processing inhibitor BofA n=1 Tax=Paenibacillus athensensis TaxID=1967502 RepID=A0A4Y8Q946_9BACL|nr:pro-sigmaK processing inhibitor BofA family protein [Paenibacillus athensensis]MCD1259959.1 pro-sigmaK processing inhibitor BofA family protein [Paenibacillus athensensis]